MKLNLVDIASYFSLQYNGKNSNKSKKEKIFIHNIMYVKRERMGAIRRSIKVNKSCDIPP